MSAKKKAKKSNRGGARPGAGRPRIGDTVMIPCSLSLPQSVVEKVDLVAPHISAKNMPRSDALRALVLLGLEKLGV